MTKSGVVVLSVDVEDWGQSTLDRSLPISPRSEKNLHDLLDLFATHGNKATMFVLGKFGERFPQAVQRIVSEGHEIASHGYGHTEIFKQSRSEFRNDVSRAKWFLEDLVGRRVIGYRAPDFSVVKRSLWAFDELVDLGFEYDSSIIPARMKRYGIDNWPASPVSVHLPLGKQILEFPLSTMSLFGKRFPVAGGGYHRLFPWSLIRVFVRKTLALQRPFVFYCHPYELDASELYDLRETIPITTRLHQGLGRKGMRSKIIRLLSTFETKSFEEVIPNTKWPDYHLGNA
ncbi:MAG: DUF3473 domain-containing protein [bacterium]